MMNNSKLKTLEKRKNYAWSQYFKAQTDAHNRELMTRRNIASVLSKVKKHNDELPKFLVDEITQLLIQSKQQVECPVCYLPISDCKKGKVTSDFGSSACTSASDLAVADDTTEYTEGLVITWCGHKLCRSCYSNAAMKECPSCRTPFTNKR